MNPYAVKDKPRGPRTAGLAAVLTGAAGLAVLGAGTASADEQDYGTSSTSGDLFTDTSQAGGGDPLDDSGSSLANGAAETFRSGDAFALSGSETGNTTAEPEPLSFDVAEVEPVLGLADVEPLSFDVAEVEPMLGLTDVELPPSEPLSDQLVPATPADLLIGVAPAPAETVAADPADSAAAEQSFPDLQIAVIPAEDSVEDGDFAVEPDDALGGGSIGLTGEAPIATFDAPPGLPISEADKADVGLGLGTGLVLGTGSAVPPDDQLVETPQSSQNGFDGLLDVPLSSRTQPLSLFSGPGVQLDDGSSAIGGIVATGTQESRADPAALGALPEDLDRLLGQDGTPTGPENLLAPDGETVTGFDVPSTGGFRLGTDVSLFRSTGSADGVGAGTSGSDALPTPGLLAPDERAVTGFTDPSTGGFRLGTGAPLFSSTADGPGDDPFGLGDLSTPRLQAEASGTGSEAIATSGSAAKNPWRITTFDEENWPPRLDLEGPALGYAIGGIGPTVALTANQRRIAAGKPLFKIFEEMPPSTLTVPRSFASDILLGGSPIEVFEGDLQNSVAKSFVSGAVITGLDEVGRTVQRNLPEIQGRNNDFWANRGNRLNPPVVTPRPGQLQLSSGLARPTVFTIAPTVTALNLGADALTDHFDIDPEPTDPNNNRYYGELLTDSMATGLGVFAPVFTENYVNREAIALRAGKPVPKAGNVVLNTALAFGFPALQTFGAGVLAEEPPDKNDPIYRGTRATAQLVADNAGRVGEAAFGEGDTADGNGANTTRTLGNATAALATPVLDALGSSIPNVFHNLGHTYDYLVTGERQPNEPIVSEEAVAATEAARVRTQGAWDAAREGDARNRWDDLGKLGANGLYALGRGGIGLAHSVVSPVTDPFQSQESRFVEEPTQAQRGQESFGRVEQAWQEAGEAVNGLLGRSPALQSGSRYPTCGGDVTNECVEPRSLRDDNRDGKADNAGVLRDSTVGAPVQGTPAYQACHDLGECGDQSVPGSPRYGSGSAGVGHVGPRIPANPTIQQLQEVYSSPAFAQHAERSFAAQAPPTPPAIVNPVQATVQRGIQAARNTAGWVGDRADDAADAAQRLPGVGGAVGWLRDRVPGLGGDSNPNR